MDELHYYAFKLYFKEYIFIIFLYVLIYCELFKINKLKKRNDDKRLKQLIANHNNRLSFFG